MAAAITRALYEEGSAAPRGAGYAEIAYNLVASGGSTTVTVKTPFTEITSIRLEPKSPGGATLSWVPNANKQWADLTFTANAVGKVYVRGRGM